MQQKQPTQDQRLRVYAHNLMMAWFAGFLTRQGNRLVQEIANDQ